jgi:hypothetical protein
MKTTWRPRGFGCRVTGNGYPFYMPPVTSGVHPAEGASLSLRLCNFYLQAFSNKHRLHCCLFLSSPQFSRNRTGYIISSLAFGTQLS